MRKKKDTHSFDFRPLGLAIREAREKAGLSRNDLGDKVFYGERHIADIENIGKHPSFQLFHDLVTMFNISPKPQPWLRWPAWPTALSFTVCYVIIVTPFIDFPFTYIIAHHWLAMRSTDENAATVSCFFSSRHKVERFSLASASP